MLMVLSNDEWRSGQHLGDSLPAKTTSRVQDPQRGWFYDAPLWGKGHERRLGCPAAHPKSREIHTDVGYLTSRGTCYEY